MKKRTSRTVILAIIYIILSVLYTWLFAPHGYIRLMDSYDILFHMNRVSSLGNIVSSPVNFQYWGHVGNMTSEFYPWLTILPGYFIFQLAGNPVTGFLISLTLVTFLTFVSSYYFMKKFSSNTLQSFLFSIIYTLAFFRMASVFYRAGVAEYICYIFVPMLFYEFSELLSGKFSKWPLFALSFSLIVLTHPLTAFTTVIIMIPLVFLILFSKVSHSWNYWYHLLLSGIESIIFVGITTLGFTLPMFQQQKYIPVNRPGLLDLASSAKDPVKMFQLATSTDLRNYSFGIIMILAVIFVVIFIWKDKLAYKLVGIEMLLALILSTSIIPWENLQDTFFNYLQFPWRFLNLFVFFAAIYMSHILTKLVDKRSPLLKLAVMLLVLVGCGSQVYASGDRLNHQITLVKPVSKLTTHNSSGYVHEFTQVDYYPQRSLPHKLKIRQHVAIVDGKRTKLHARVTTSSFIAKYYNVESSTIDLPVLVYKGVNVSINNETAPYTVSDRGTVQIKTKPGQNQIEVSYHYSTVAKASIGISIVGFIALIWLCINQGKILPVSERKNKQAKKAENS
ncbi:DUF6541 family protein [Companilactobacillus ginsenosidimutans]|uniref:CRIB domain-containing protein n=1 Tax=Companilactobacillus ginsenosidimutans TaxID=1007676 RepID=A0A0H4QJ70_9LACO|nr:hypothetical protein [Companilactobacillus ginsenosidimutans]AKP66728.1 hypothetical protein ABM34_03545 [Companilactobacillus ginsenosidimutans]